MTLQNKILVSNTILTIITTGVIAVVTDTFPGNGFFLMLGTICMIAGMACLGLGLLWLPRKDKRFSTGYLLSSLMLLPIGGISLFFLNSY